MKISYDGGTVSGVAAGEPGPTGVLLAHGAGAGQRHSWIVHVRDGLARRGLFVMSFDYRYTEARRKAPDRMPTLLAVHRAAADALAGECDRVVLAGKSMGGRVGSHLAGDEGWPAAGLVYFGYPLVPVGKREPRPTDHLAAIAAPQLFFTGTRDRLSPPALIADIAAKVPDGTLVVVEDGDHSFKVLKRGPKTNEQVLDKVVDDAARWIHTRVGPRAQGL
jgi:predicted alpha/beta-hydrolase family hydrolase